MRIGILLTGDYGWAGGLYYSLNIIKLLQAASVEQKLTVVVIINQSTPPELLNELTHKNTVIVNLDERTLFYRIYCKLIGKLTNSNFRFMKDINSLKLDVLYPIINWEPVHRKLNCRVYYWIYDFQHKFLPELFSAAEITKRDTTFQHIAENAQDIVLSSVDAEKHFHTFYPQSKAKINVYKFISLLQKLSLGTQIPAGLPDNYFIVCNQFWPHKNHMVVLKALQSLLEQNKIAHVVFTGKHNDVRHKAYVDELLSFISDKGLTPFVTLTGFISREEQTILMQHAKAIIQPSFFEGWSTVIEDAKALNQFLIVSDIAINREQVTDHVLFFDPSDSKALATCMAELLEKEMPGNTLNYQLNIEKSKHDLINLLIH